MELDVSDAGRLREDAILNYEEIAKMKVDTLPIRSQIWWQDLHKTLNSDAAI